VTLHQAPLDPAGAQNIMTPIVFVTGYDDESLATILEGESVALLRKPFGSKELLTQVAVVIGDRGSPS
jgi:CheY-like chemotaxis protein